MYFKLRKNFKSKGFSRYEWSENVHIISPSTHAQRYTFEDWNRNTYEDGWVCRNDLDCDWIDAQLGCDDREFDLDSVQVIKFLY